MKKKNIQETAGFTKYTMRKLGTGEAVTTDILAKIYRDLNCMFDILWKFYLKISDKSILWDSKCFITDNG